MADRAVTVGAAPLTIDDVVRVARDRASMVVTPEARARLHAARAVVEHLAASPTAHYGVNSALGANTGQPLAPSDRADYQTRAVRARAVAVGRSYSACAVRAMLAARVAGMAVGGSGVSPAVLDALIALLDRGVHPVVPRVGSIGAADLPQLAHLALPLIGEGEAEWDGHVMPSATALEHAGLKPVALGAKDGLSLVSANAATIGCAALVLHDARILFDRWLAAIALSFEGFRANVSPLDPRAVAARPAPGQVEIAARLRALLEESALLASPPRRVQDPLSFRVVAQVQGSLQAALRAVRELVEIELASAAESPLVIAADGVMLSNGNFHVPALTVALDAAAIAIAQSASLGAERVIRFMSPAFTDLPLQLTRRGPAHSGFATLQKTVTALWSEIRLRANPASLDFLPVSEGAEDHATMALGCVERLADMLERLRYLVAIELLVAAQAVDLREIPADALGTGPRAALARVREIVPMLDEDRPLGPDVNAVATAVAGGSFAATPA